MTTKTITGTYSAGYTLSASYSALVATASADVGGKGITVNSVATVTNSGTVADAAAPGLTTGYAGISLSVAGGEVVNYGAVTGGQGGGGGPGGSGVYLGAGLAVNHGDITGGRGGGSGASGGNAVYLANAGTLTNLAGTITGGAGGPSAGAGARGGPGGSGFIALALAHVNNSAVIVGGAGVSGGHGGYGLELLGASVIVNTGTVIGGAGAGDARGGPGAYLLLFGFVENEGGLIEGGAGGANALGGTLSAAGVALRRGERSPTPGRSRAAGSAPE